MSLQHFHDTIGVMNLRRLFVFVLLVASIPHSIQAEDMSDAFSYPPISSQQKIWSRWWWLGSAVDRENLTELLSAYRDAGIGGVEICPIYGAKGHEHRYIPYLSPQWMEMLAHTTAEAKRLGMGVDLTTGTGWPFGGPQVGDENASMSVTVARIAYAQGKLAEPLPKGSVLSAIAISESGAQVDLGRSVNPPGGEGSIYALIASQPIQKVKRAAPGAEGNVVDPYSIPALDSYLKKFDDAFTAAKLEMPRAHFHDSFEYFKANWTPSFLDEFQKRRGYDLRNHLPTLMDEGDDQTIARVKCDYRETIHDLHLEYIERWNAWAHSHGGLSRNQAHGAPGNLLDLYAAADIPETEIFGEVPDSEFVRMKFTSSAAHLKGTAMASAEAFTWLGEHFQVSLNDLKKPADFMFLAGINHLFFHGIPYSPKDVEWPGWLFYASVHFGPQGGLWRDLPAFNAYVARCQAILQSGQPDEDLLIYYPQYDLWQQKEGLFRQCGVHNQEEWLHDTPFHRLAETLRAAGYGYEVISDRFIEKARVEGGAIVVGEQRYKAMVAPLTRVMSPATLAKLDAFAKAGAKVIFETTLPDDVPGMASREKRLASLRGITSSGSLAPSRNVLETLAAGAVRRETMVGHELQYLRRRNEQGHLYFLVNRGDKPFDGWIELAVAAKSVVAMDPLAEKRVGLAAIKPGDRTQVYLQLQPGESIILKALTAEQASGPRWVYSTPTGPAVELKGRWSVEFIDGGPVLPKSYETEVLESWTKRDDPETKRFCGTARYRLVFARPEGKADIWRLDLGKVADSARVTLNGHAVGTLWCEPFRVDVGPFLRDGENELVVEITNVAANRIADADRRGVPWKAFHEINFVNKDYKPFDASTWPVREAGLLGPVRIRGFARVDPVHPPG